jgi:hypothetical protein
MELKFVDDSSPSPHETMAEMSGDGAGSTAATSTAQQHKWGKERVGSGRRKTTPSNSYFRPPISDMWGQLTTTLTGTSSLHPKLATSTLTVGPTYRNNC